MSTPTPHPVLIRLAHALLRKAERSQGERGVFLRLDAAALPELHQAATPDALTHIGLLLDQLKHAGWVDVRLKRAQAFQTLADRDPTLVLLDATALAAWSDFIPSPPRWSRQLVQALRQPDVLQVPNAGALLDYLLRNPLPWLEYQAHADCAQTLNALARDCASGQGLYLRELSARHFRGHSKVLDTREELLRLLGAAEGQFLEVPIQLLVSLPPAHGDLPPFTEVIFIENLVSFERMAQARHPGWAQAALAYASGFKGAAKRLRTRQGSSLYWRDGSAPEVTDAFGRWLYGDVETGAASTQVRFYGDLDFSGMHILSQLRQSFPDCQAWQPGYTALLNQLGGPASHAPSAAAKEGQTDPGLTGCKFADDSLLPALRQSGRCVDQELWPAHPASPPIHEQPSAWTSTTSPTTS